MKAIFNIKIDTLTLRLKGGPVAESDEQKPGVILDYDADGNLIGLEVLDASKKMANARSLEFQVAE